MMGKLAKQLKHIFVRHRAICILNTTIILTRSMRVYLNWITISVKRGKDGAGDEIDRVDGCEADSGHP